MKQKIALVLLLTSFHGLAQSVIEWSPGYQVKLEDFQSPQTEIDEQLTSYSILSGTGMDFDFHMPTAQFIFTKNFNSKVATTFNRSAAAIIAPDTLSAQALVSFGQYSFDLTELYSRKFRKEIYEQKGAFSDVGFFQPIYDKIHAGLNAELGRVLKLTDFGRKEEILEEEHQKVLLQIEELSDFCKKCKSQKKRK